MTNVSQRVDYRRQHLGAMLRRYADATALLAVEGTHDSYRNLQDVWWQVEAARAALVRAREDASLLNS